MRKSIIIVILLLSLLFPLTEAEAQNKQITPQSLIEDVVQQLDNIKDFKGTVLTKVYTNNKVLSSRTQIMKSETRSMTRNHGESQLEDGESSLLLNTIPWIYLPPSYEIIRSSLPLAAQSEYKNPLQIANKLYDMKLLGEATYQQRDVYILELQNVFSTQRIFIDQQYLAIRKIEIFNGSNIKVATLSYDNFKLFLEEVWLPTNIVVTDSVGQKVLEIDYQDWKMNLGLTDFDFLKGFETDYQTKINKLQDQLATSQHKDQLYLKLSKLYQENGEIDQAISSLEKAISINNKIEYHKKLANLYRQQGLYDNALGELKSALQLNYDNAEIHYLLGEVQLQLGNSDGARNYLEKSVSYQQENTKYLEKLFWVYKNLANKNNDLYMLERAEKTINKLVKLAPDNENYRIYLGDIYLKIGKTIKAADAYHKAVDLAPKDTWVYIKLANYYQEIKRYQKAEELYRYVIYLEDSLENHRRLADLYFEQKKYQLALEEYQVIANRSVNNNEIKLRLAETYVAVEKPDQALEIFKQVLQQKEADQLYTKIIKIINNYQTETALEILHRLLQTENILSAQQRQDIYQKLGAIYYKQVKQEEEEKIEELLPLKSQAEIYGFLGKLEFSAGNLNEAIHYFKKSLVENPQRDNYYNLAITYLLMDQFSLARDQAKQLEQLGLAVKGEKIKELSYALAEWEEKYNQEYVPGRVNLIEGNQLRQQGNLAKAKIEYQAAVSENYDYQPPYFYLGLIYSLGSDDIKLDLVKNGIKDQNLELLNQLISVINQVKV